MQGDADAPTAPALPPESLILVGFFPIDKPARAAEHPLLHPAYGVYLALGIMSGDSVTIKLPKPHFTLFDGKRNDLPEVVVVNDALLAFEHTDIFAWHLEVTLHAVELADQGMPSSDESRLLFSIGDKIEQTVVGYNAIFLARSTWNGFRQLAFRVYDPEVANTALQELLAKEQSRFWEFKMLHDPSWQEAALYFQLFPSASCNDA